MFANRRGQLNDAVLRFEQEGLVPFHKLLMMRQDCIDSVQVHLDKGGIICNSGWTREARGSGRLENKVGWNSR